MYIILCRVADKLKGLFLLFAGHFIPNAVSLLDQNHSHKQGTVGSEVRGHLLQCHSVVHVVGLWCIVDRKM